MTPDRGTAPPHGEKEKKKLILKECETDVFLKQQEDEIWESAFIRYS